MTPMLDIFRQEGTGVRWLETAATLERAKARIQEFGVRSPGEYLILDHQTGNKHWIKIEGIEGRSIVTESKPSMEAGRP